MAESPRSDSDVISRRGGKAEAPQPGKGGENAINNLVEKFRALPRPMQILVVIGCCLFVLFLFSHRGGNKAPVPNNGGSLNLGTMHGAPGSVSATFSGIETDRPALMQSVFEQNRRDMTELREKIETDFQQRDQALQQALEQNQQLQSQMQNMMTDFTSELKNLQDERARDSERLGQLAQQQHEMEMNAPTNGASGISPVAARRHPITQVPLGGGVTGSGGGQALLSPLHGLDNLTGSHLSSNGEVENDIPPEDHRLPFMPPLGFVKATLINGVDALVGQVNTPALARISGTYKTAMNTTVSLDGCIVLIMFGANISTERAVGQPTQMTCVYPDYGTATYNLSGYVVDANDGVIGVPGVLYEGDASRIAAAAMADFAAGIGQIITQNQQTNTVDSEGTAQQTLTGSQAKAQIGGGITSAMSSLRDYLKERVDRVQSFIRLDATRQVDLVITNGTELRHEGQGWTPLFDAAQVDAAVPGTSTGSSRPAAKAALQGN